jgi:hypothetical protein
MMTGNRAAFEIILWAVSKERMPFGSLIVPLPFINIKIRNNVYKKKSYSTLN